MSVLIRIFVAGLPVFVQRMREIVASVDDLRLVGETANGLDAVEQVRTLLPDVVLLSAGLPVLGGFQATHRIIDVCPHTRVILFSPYCTEDAMWVARQAGAEALLLTDAPATEILGAIRAAIRTACTQDTEAARPSTDA